MSSLLWIIFVVCSSVVVRALKECKKVDVCKCSTDEGLIDLWSLAGKGSDIPRFKNIPDHKETHVEYSWNPCNPWTQLPPSQYNTCTDVAACIELAGTIHYDIGKQSSADFSFNDTTSVCVLKLEGSNVGSAYTKSFTYISLQCNKEEEGSLTHLESIQNDETKTLSVYMALQTKYACVGGGLSVGSILIIIFFSLLVVYLISGILFNKYSKGASGTELIPNASFWYDFPLLVKDGAVFSYGCCRKICSRKEGYESI